ncbi:MAG: formimidoylglutamate deiminase [Robiginitomaculum sp.]|nr:formimidoylglutamate deiminase [Robiginitomaculum sp.]MDQ7078556.1 formimidoylglutamate deiminase [Robiginitomaculum sp.]
METALFARHALLPTGWAHHVRLCFSAEGNLGTIKTGTKAKPGDHLADIVVPGMANLHCHAFQRAMAGLAERAGPDKDSFWTWRETMYQIAHTMDPDALRAIAAMAYVDMLESGFTCVGEFHYLHHGPDGRPYDNPAEMATQVIHAARQTGIGQTLLPVFYAQGGFGGAALSARQKRFAHDLDGFISLMQAIHEQHPGTKLGIAPHSLRAVSPEQLNALVTAFPHGPVHIHIAEQFREVEESYVHLGGPPVRWLFDHMEVDERWCLVHATHMREDEIRDLASSGAVVGLCPITEANLGDGFFPAREYGWKNGRFGIGSDSCVHIDLAEELRLLDYGQRLQSQSRTPLAPPGASSGRTLFKSALKGGAQALDQNTGALCVGKRADLVTLDGTHPALVARHKDAWLDGWIYAANTSPIVDVYVGGQKQVENGRHKGRDALQAAFGRTLKRILP